MKRGNVLLAGYVGGVLPYLLGMAKEAVSGAPSAGTYLYLNGGYWVGTLIFGAIGALVAFYLGETEIRKALAMGAAAPGLVLGLGQGGQGTNVATLDLPSRKPPVAWLVGTAQAQEAKPARARYAPDTLWVHVLGVDSLRGGRVELVALVRQTPAGSSAVAYRLTSSSTMVPLRRAATTGVFLMVDGAATDTIGTASVPGDTLTLRLSVRDRSFFSGFARTFGVHSVAPRQPVLTVVR